MSKKQHVLAPIMLTQSFKLLRRQPRSVLLHWLCQLARSLALRPALLLRREAHQHLHYHCCWRL